MLYHAWYARGVPASCSTPPSPSPSLHDPLPVRPLHLPCSQARLFASQPHVALARLTSALSPAELDSATARAEAKCEAQQAGAGPYAWLLWATLEVP